VISILDLFFKDRLFLFFNAIIVCILQHAATHYIQKDQYQLGFTLF